MHRTPIFIPLCAVAMAIAAAPAAALEPQSNSVSTANKPTKKVCRWVDRTGTHMLERICLTAEEWRQVEEFIAKQF